MTPVQVTQYRAADGKMFATESECRAHERESAPMRLVGLTIEQINAALSREDGDLAEAIEECGNRVRRARLAAGEKKRERKSSEMAAGVLHEPGTDPTDAETREGLKNAPPADPETRGAAAFIAGEGGIVPDDLKDDPDGSEKWLRGWDAASLANREKNDAAARQATGKQPAEAAP